MSRDLILGRVRSALGRKPGQGIPTPPPVWLLETDWTLERKLASFKEKLERLAGVVHVAESPSDAREIVAGLIAGKTAVASNAALLAELGITSLPGVTVAGKDREQSRALCAACAFGITGAALALAETGTLVMQANSEEARLVSLLPPVHIAVVSKEQLIVDLDELLARIPKPVEDSSSMVLITGPSRTGDIEQILVRGVHGPGVVHVVFL